MQQAGADTAARSGPDKPFEVVTLPPIEPTLSVVPSRAAEPASDPDPFCGSPAKQLHDRLLCRILLHTLGTA
jgi:hypothetical protein